ncbi:hypothetical protein PF005_g17504 [Phytophthora fragariae]|uniref:Uncharacterized protein n=1 Tax=Phytophthora fragariae TaxID=53985 RepID=A0A6A3X492_9STRA|nr:hypothetical protein PF007_g17638 [Phytophthora fragariae]KAE9194903.1 hypothetical protein PF005_g17504 [Phytophthora fragariae]
MFALQSANSHLGVTPPSLHPIDASIELPIKATDNYFTTVYPSPNNSTVVMTGQRRSKVAPRRSWHSMTGLLLHSRALHSTMATLEHHETCAPLMSEMPRVRGISPRRRTIEIQQPPRAAPAAKPLAKPLVFRKTKRELEREQQQRAREQLEMQQRKDLCVVERTKEIGQTKRARPKHGAGGVGDDRRCVLAKMPFVQELFDLKPKKPSAHDEKSISFQDRYQAYKRKRNATRIS